MGWDFGMEADLAHVPADLGVLQALGAWVEDERVVFPLDAGYTFNVAPMYYEAFGDDVPRDGGRGGLRSLHKMKGGDAIPALEVAIERMKADPSKYKAMNPPNGWGDYEGALGTLETLLSWCKQLPFARLTIY